MRNGMGKIKQPQRRPAVWGKNAYLTVASEEERREEKRREEKRREEKRREERKRREEA